MASDDFSRFVLPGSYAQIILLDVGVEVVGSLGHCGMDNVGNSNDVVFGVLSRLFKLIGCSIYDALDDVELTLGIVREETWGDTISLKGLSNGLCFLQGGVGHC